MSIVQRLIASGLAGSLWLISLSGGGGPTAQASSPSNPIGVDVSGLGRAPDIVGTLLDLDAHWVRVNGHLDGNDQDFTRYLAGGLNMVITLNNTDPTNVDTTYGTPAQWPNAGFPYLSKDVYEQDIRSSLAPVLPYLDDGRQVWVQAENEVGDVALNPSARYWRGTDDQYMTLLEAFNDAVKGLDPRLQVVMSSFTTQALDAVIDPSNPRHGYQVQRMTQMIATGRYDAVDLHFYGCFEDIPAKIQWITDQLPAGKRWISTENAGPDDRCPTTPTPWHDDPAAFEQTEAQQVPERLSACVDGGGSVCLWFALFDLRGEVEQFAHFGLLDPWSLHPREKPAYEAFKEFASSGDRTISIDASRTRVARGSTLRLTGSIVGGSDCVSGQAVELQSRRGHGFATIDTSTTHASGGYRFAVRVEYTTRYRVAASASGICERTTSRAVRVRVR